VPLRDEIVGLPVKSHTVRLAPGRLGPAGNVVVSVYSSGAIGRLVPDDVVGVVRYPREHSPAATA
jgi:hypothetical protein